MVYPADERFQSSTRQTDFATLLQMGFSFFVAVVSILYEADRLCNVTQEVEDKEDNTMFQSSTRQTDFATA